METITQEDCTALGMCKLHWRLISPTVAEDALLSGLTVEDISAGIKQLYQPTELPETQLQMTCLITLENISHESGLIYCTAPSKSDDARQKVTFGVLADITVLEKLSVNEDGETYYKCPVSRLPIKGFVFLANLKVAQISAYLSDDKLLEQQQLQNMYTSAARVNSKSLHSVSDIKQFAGVFYAMSDSLFAFLLHVGLDLKKLQVLLQLQSKLHTDAMQASTSVFSGLLNSPQDLDILIELYTAFPVLKQGITATTLCALNVTEISALYWLVSSAKGLLFLKLLLQVNPTLAAGITSAALCRLVPGEAGKNANTSVLFQLVIASDGLQLLETLLEANPGLINETFASALCALLPASAGKLANTSALSWLTTTKRHQKFLLELLRNPTISTRISSKPLRVKFWNSGINTSALNLLSETAEGWQILALLYFANEELYHIVRGRMLSLLQPKTDVAINALKFCLMIQNEEGRQLLNVWLLTNVNLVQTINVDMFSTLLPDSAGELANTSALYWLTSTNAGWNILSFLCEKLPNLKTVISATALCAVRPASAGPLANTSPLFFMASSFQGLLFLNEIFTLKEESPELYSAYMQGITAEALYACLPAAARDSANMSAFFWLTTTSLGLQLLSRLYKANPKLKKGISADALYVRTLVSEKSAFSHLLGSAEGWKLLMDLFDVNPDLKRQISSNELCVSFKIKTGDTTTGLFLLITRPGGIRLLFDLLYENHQIMEGISAEALCSPLEYGDNAGLTALSLLQSTKGKLLLRRLFQLNPKLEHDISAIELKPSWDACNKKTGVSEDDILELINSMQIEVLCILLANSNDSQQSWIVKHVACYMSNAVLTDIVNLATSDKIAARALGNVVRSGTLDTKNDTEKAIAVEMYLQASDKQLIVQYGSPLRKCFIIAEAKFRLARRTQSSVSTSNYLNTIYTIQQDLISTIKERYSKNDDRLIDALNDNSFTMLHTLASRFPGSWLNSTQKPIDEFNAWQREGTGSYCSFTYSDKYR